MADGSVSGRLADDFGASLPAGRFRVQARLAASRASCHRFQFDKMGRVTIDARCTCASMSVKPEQTDELVSMFKTWRSEYWMPLEQNREFASHFRQTQRLGAAVPRRANGLPARRSAEQHRGRRPGRGARHAGGIANDIGLLSAVLLVRARGGSASVKTVMKERSSPCRCTFSTESASRDTAAYGGFVDAIGGAATIVLAIIGLSGAKPEMLLAVATSSSERPCSSRERRCCPNTPG